MRTTESPAEHQNIVRASITILDQPLTNSISDCFFVVWNHLVCVQPQRSDHRYLDRLFTIVILLNGIYRLFDFSKYQVAMTVVRLDTLVTSHRIAVQDAYV